MFLKRTTGLAVASLLCILEAPAQQRGRRPKLPPEESQVQQWMAAMSLRDKIAQLIVIPFYGENPHSKSAAFRKFSTAVSELHVGGMILVNRVRQGLAINAEPVTAAAFLNRMQKLAKVPLIAGADFERGASMRVSGTTKFPHNMAFAAARDLAATRKLGEVTARESRAMGVHWVFAPVADVNNNPGNP
ncbi:MAG: hypothetical protein HYZ37_07665, partial [Candidatus Solibacter usitatus]|nr:hypothetical protein [Candidatus Solibacter usitatus]